VELHQILVEVTRKNLARAGIKNVDVHQGDALLGLVDESPFDVIAVTGSLPTDELLPKLQMQLRIGGRMFVVVGEDPVMEALLITRVSESGYQREGLFETSIPPLANAPEPQRFRF
jgi:protein-L-isoaspartate(D-aspartate) O-methyltransferase